MISRSTFFLAVIWLSCFVHSSEAQLSTYVFTQSVQGYSNTTHGLDLGTPSNTGLRSFLDPLQLSGSTTQTSGPGFPIGFNFEFNGIVYDRFGVINSGWICLGRSAYGQQAVDIGQLQFQPLEKFGPSIDTLRARICGMDANLQGNGTSSSLTYELRGDTGQYVLIIKWKNYRLFQSSGTNNTAINFEIRLHQADQSIHLRYGEMSLAGYPGQYNSNVGIGGLAINDFANRKTPANRNWNATTAGTLYTDDCVLHGLTIIPEYGLDFSWKPSACPGIPKINTLAITSNLATLKWKASPSIPSPQYEYALTTSPIPPGSGTVTTDTILTFTGLNPGTLYYLHIRVKCESAINSIWTSHPIKTQCEPQAPPYYEGFESVTAPALPLCMRVINNNPASQTWITAEETGLSGLNGLIMPYEPVITNEGDWIFFRGIDLAADSTYILSLDYFNPNFAGLLAYVGPQPVIDSMIFIDTLMVENDYTFSQDYLLYTPAVSGIHYFALYTESADLQVDNIVLEKFDCSQPVNIHVTDNVPGDLTIAWTSATSSTTFQYAISQSGNYPPSNVLTVNDTSVHFTNLTSGKTYYLFLRTSCGGPSYAPWERFVFETKSLYDECATAHELEVSSAAECDYESFATVGATSSGVPSAQCEGVTDDDVWLKFVATERSHVIRLFNLCLGGGGGGGSLHENPSSTRMSMPNLCQPLILELRPAGCGDTVISCVEIAPGTQGKLIRTDLAIDSVYYIRVFGLDTAVAGQIFSLCVGTYPEETNNDCATAIAVPVSTGSCPTTNIKDIAGATPSSQPVSTCGSAPYYDLWYKFIATSTTHLVNVTFSDGGDGVVDVFSGACGNMTLLACANETTSGSEQISLSGLSIGQTLYIRVYDAAGSGLQMMAAVCVKIPVINDECADAVEITTVTGITMSGSHDVNSFSASGLGGCSGYYADDDVWYKFTAVNDSHIVSVIGLNPVANVIAMQTPVIEVFSGGCDGTSLGCSNTGDLQFNTLEPGQEYHIRIFSANNVTGRGNVRVGVTVPLPHLKCADALPIIANTQPGCDIKNQVTNIGTGSVNRVWYKFVAPHSTLSLFSDHISSMAVYDSCGGFPITQNSNGNYSDQFIPGHTYYVSLLTNIFANQNYQYFQEIGDVCISPAPGNDECDAPIHVQIDSFATLPYSGSLAGATPSEFPPQCNTERDDLWYSFTANSHEHQIKVEGVEFVEIYKDCLSAPIVCFNPSSFLYPGHVVSLDIFQPDSTYLIRLAKNLHLTSIDTFRLTITSRPVNDICYFATPLQLGTTSQCKNPLYGSTVNATPSEGRKNLWYTFTALSKNISLVVKPMTPGFDPAIRLYEKNFNHTFEDCVSWLLQTTDETHVSFQSEVLTLSNLVIGDEYMVEVYDGYESENSGTFEICSFTPGNIMTLYGAFYETYPYDTLVSAGTWNQPVLGLMLQMSGTSRNKTIRSLKFNFEGTTDTADILSASAYVRSSQIFDSESIEEFQPFGNSGGGLSFSPPPTKFGNTIDHPGTGIEFISDYVITGENTGAVFGSETYYRTIYLVVELKCDADPGNQLLAHCESITLDDDIVIPVPGDVYPMILDTLSRYDTRQDGDWMNGDTWVCGSAPPSTHDLPLVSINHDVGLSDTVTTGSVEVQFLSTLSLHEAQLTLGHSSMGSFTGHSDKLMSVKEGGLILDESTLMINGGLDFGTFSAEMQGNGLCCGSGNGYYKLTHGSSTLTRDSAYVSADYYSFYVEDGEVIQHATGTPASNNTARAANPPVYSLFSEAASRTPVLFPGDNHVYKTLELDANTLQSMLDVRLEKIKLTLPGPGNTEWKTSLRRDTKLLNNTIWTNASDGSPLPASDIVLYSGTIDNVERGAVTMCVVDGQVQFAITHGDEHYAITRLPNSNVYTAHNEPHIKFLPEQICMTSDEGVFYTREQLQYKADNRSSDNCVRLYLEIDFDIYQEKGSVANAVAYVAGLMQQVALLFEAEDIEIAVSEFGIWTSPSPYTEGTPFRLLSQFELQTDGFHGDLGLLLSYKSTGGIARINGLCADFRDQSLGFAHILSTYANVPLYSYSVYALAHNIGHLLGSLHTHACVWSGNNTAIDNCYPVEGDCDSGGLPLNGGTIMSHCGAVPEVGINFEEGFGLQPGNVMRYNIDHAGCLSDCADPDCDEALVLLTIKTDNKPADVQWTLRNEAGVIVDKGGPYVTANSMFQHGFCLADGWYSFLINDIFNPLPGGSLVIANSSVILDGIDGEHENDFAQFRILTTNYFTEHANVTMLDPGKIQIGNQFNRDQHFNGTIRFGGGDDTYDATGFQLAAQGINSFTITTFDSVIVNGGMHADHRHVRFTGNLVGMKNLLVMPGAEVEGGIAITGNLVNHGLISSLPGRNLSFCGSLNFAEHLPNYDTIQTLSGTGFFRNSVADPVPQSQTENRLRMLAVNNLAGGLHLEMPLNVVNVLRMQYGNIINDSLSLLTLGDSISGGVLTSDPTYMVWFVEDPFEGDVQQYSGGYITGPFRRWYSGATALNETFLPVGTPNAGRMLNLEFDSTQNGYVTAQFIAEDPRLDGLPLSNEQGTNISAVSPDGYWRILSDNTSGLYALQADASGFTTDGLMEITSPGATRLIKRPTGGSWSLSNSTTQFGPADLAHVNAQGLSGFSDFGVGLSCSNVVTTEADSGPGSLRSVLATCVSSGDTVRFDTGLSLILLTSDKIILNKNVILFARSNDELVIKGIGDHTLFEIETGFSPTFVNLDMEAGQFTGGSSFINHGHLTLHDVIIYEENSGSTTVHNEGTLTIRGNTQIKMQ